MTQTQFIVAVVVIFTMAVFQNLVWADDKSDEISMRFMYMKQANENNECIRELKQALNYLNAQAESQNINNNECEKEFIKTANDNIKSLDSDYVKFVDKEFDNLF